MTPPEQRAAVERVEEIRRKLSYGLESPFTVWEMADWILAARDLVSHTDALLTREREARRLALEEAAQVAEHWYNLPPIEIITDASTTEQIIAAYIRARAKEEGNE